MPAPAHGSHDTGTAKMTSLLNEAGAGDAQASADLLPLVYEELRSLAARKMCAGASGSDLAGDGAGARGLSSPGRHQQSAALGKPLAFLRRRGGSHAPHPR